MKPVLMVIFFIGSLLNAQAQLTRGNWLVGGNAKMYTYQDNQVYPTSSVQYSMIDLDISGTAGYFLADKFALGLRPGFSWFKGHWIGATGGVSGGSTNTKRYYIGPFARYYFLNEEKPFNILGDVCYRFGAADYKDLDGRMNEFSFLGGPVIFFNSAVGMEILLGYVYKIEDVPGYYRYEKKGFQVGVGLQIHLTK